LKQSPIIFKRMLDYIWIFCALAESAGRMAHRASYRSEEIGQEEA